MQTLQPRRRKANGRAVCGAMGGRGNARLALVQLANGATDAAATTVVDIAEFAGVASTASLHNIHLTWASIDRLAGRARHGVAPGLLTKLRCDTGYCEGGFSNLTQFERRNTNRYLIFGLIFGLIFRLVFPRMHPHMQFFPYCKVHI